MNHELICSCLRLSSTSWPPDHYTLLGLEPGEVDTRRIEQRVQERMEKLRRYQLTHPEQATEGMNRLAQALVCLTDPIAKEAYDAALSGRPGDPQTKARSVRQFSMIVEESDEVVPSRARSSSRWLLLAWILWLAIGVAGLAATVIYFSDILASYHGHRKELGPATKGPPTPSRSKPSERPAHAFRE